MTLHELLQLVPEGGFVKVEHFQNQDAYEFTFAGKSEPRGRPMNSVMITREFEKLVEPEVFDQYLKLTVQSLHKLINS